MSSPPPAGAASVVQRARVLAPNTLDEASQLLRAARDNGEAVSFLGGGTETGYGNPPARVGVLVKTERLKRIVEYAPSDMVITAEAGLTLAALQRSLSAQKQRLALDAPLAERATIGGLIATDGYGPRRARYGRLRDLVVGMTILRADGERVRGGGKVVKNVAGFDLPKLMIGSLGTLGMIATATFRLHPMPEVSRWTSIGPLTAAELHAIVVAVRERRLEPAAYVAERARDTHTLYVLFEGFESGVAEQQEAFFSLVPGLHPVAAVERNVAAIDERARATGELRVRVSIPPADFVRVDREVLEPLQRTLQRAACSVYPSLGIAFLGGDLIDAGAVMPALSAARERVEAIGGNLVVTALPASLSGRIDSFGSPPASFPIMRRLKDRFDPEHRLNPGRFIGGL